MVARQLLEHLRRRRPGHADVDDVRACYRLLLGREADPDGLAHWAGQVADGRLGVEALVTAFLGSEEFLRHYGSVVSAPPLTEPVELADGLVVHLDRRDWAVGSPLSRTGTYEPEVTEVVLGSLRAGATFVDVGANIGWFALHAARVVGPTGTVVAVEPNPANCDLLERSAAANGFTNITVVAAAASSSPGWAALETDASNGHIVPLVGDGGAPVRCSYAVALRPLDDILAGLGVDAVDVMKVDTEGAEPLVLAGASRTLAQRPVLVSEFFPAALADTSGIAPTEHLARLRRAGYQLAVIGEPDGPLDDDAIMAVVARRGVDHLDLVARPA